MSADHSIKCNGGRGISARVLAGIIVAIFPIGVPLGLFILLYSHRHEIMQRESRSGEGELGYIGE